MQQNRAVMAQPKGRHIENPRTACQHCTECGRPVGERSSRNWSLEGQGRSHSGLTPREERSTRHGSFLVETERTSDTHSESLQANVIGLRPPTYSATVRTGVSCSDVSIVGERSAWQESQEESLAGCRSGTLLDPGLGSRPPTYSAATRTQPPSYESLMGTRIYIPHVVRLGFETLTMKTKITTTFFDLCLTFHLYIKSVVIFKDSFIRRGNWCSLGHFFFLGLLNKYP